MKKLVLSSAVGALLLASGVQANTVSDPIPVNGSNLPVPAETDVNTVYLSGASAVNAFIESLFSGLNGSTVLTIPAEDKICDTSKNVWKYKDSGSNQAVYLCTRATTNTTLPTNKPYLRIYKRSEGGSAFGVSPIIAENNGDNTSASIEFLKIASGCSSTTSPTAGTVMGVITCDYSSTDANKHAKHIPDFGVSDVDPLQFTGVNAPSGYADVSEADVDPGVLTIKSGPAAIHGIIVTKDLYFALQAAQIANGTLSGCAVGSETEACMPSLNSAQIASIQAGYWSDWDQLKVTGTTGLHAWATTNAASYLPGAKFLHTCRRENGSGTQATANINFLHNSCLGSVALSPATDAVLGGVGEGSGTMVHENSTSGSLGECMDELQTGGNAIGTAFNNAWGKRWALGINSLDKKTSTSSNWRFVKVDGVAPSLANLSTGKYKDWVETTFQYGASHFSDANLKKLADAVITAASQPDVVSALNKGQTHTFLTAATAGGYAISPTVVAPAAGGALDYAKPVIPYSHTPDADTPLNNCRTPAVYLNGDAKL